MLESNRPRDSRRGRLQTVSLGTKVSRTSWSLVQAKPWATVTRVKPCYRRRLGQLAEVLTGGGTLYASKNSRRGPGEDRVLPWNAPKPTPAGGRFSFYL